MAKGLYTMPYAIDLFCGAGGCSEGLLQAGFDILFSSDISEMAEITYRNRHKQLGLIQGHNTWFERADIKDLTGDIIRKRIMALDIFKDKEMPDIDLMIGGPSCQGFSRAGRRDKKDPRNMLFSQYVRVISEVRPKYIVLENVEGFMDMQFDDFVGLTGIKYPDGSVTPQILRSELNEIGYTTLEPKILNAAEFGVPQRRNRVIFIGYRDDVQSPEYPKPELDPNHFVTLKDAIGDLITDPTVRKKVNPVLSGYQKACINGRTPATNGHPIKAKTTENTELSKITDIVEERFSLFRPGETGTLLRKRVKDEGIDLTGKNALLVLCSDAFEMLPKDVLTLFKSAKATDEQIDVLLTKKNIRQR